MHCCLKIAPSVREPIIVVYNESALSSSDVADLLVLFDRAIAIKAFRLSDVPRSEANFVPARLEAALFKVHLFELRSHGIDRIVYLDADTVVADTLDLQAGGERRGIVDAARHPDWSSDTGLDAALVLLDAPIEGVAPALLDSPCRDLPAEGSTAHVYGWGATREDGVGSSPVLQRGAVEVTDPTCTTTPTCRGAVDGELVAAGSGVDACVGDSGGPLVDGRS